MNGPVDPRNKDAYDFSPPGGQVDCFSPHRFSVLKFKMMATGRLGDCGLCVAIVQEGEKENRPVTEENP